MIEKLTTKVSINTQGEAIRFANACYEVAEEFAIGFGEWIFNQNPISLTKKSGLDNSYMRKSAKELLEIYKKEKELLNQNL